MPEPILMPDGNAITNWDQNVIEVTAPTGQKLRVARAAAPPQLQQSVAQAERGEGGPAALVRQPAGNGSPFGFIDPNTPAPGSSVPSTRVPVPSAPMASGDPAPDPVAGGMASPMAAVDAEIARRRQLEAQRGPASGGAATRTATSTTRLPAEAAAEVRDMQTPIDESVAEQQLAVERQGDTEANALGEVSKIHAAQGARIEQELKDQEGLRQSYEQRFAAEQQKLAELNQRAQVEIDPGKYWKDKGTGNKILAAVSMAIGAFVHARSEGRVANTPAQIIQTAIERDIDAQLENRNRAERDVTRQAGVIGLLGDKYSDDLQKRQAALVLASEAAAKQIDGIAAGMQAGQAQDKALQLSAQLRQANAQRAQEFAAQVAGTETTQTQTVSGGGGRGGSSADALSAAAYGEGGVYDAKTYIPASVQVMGEHRAALNESDQVELNKMMAANAAMQRKVDQIESIAKGGGKISPQAKTDVTSAYASLLLDVKTAEGLGALDAGATEVAKDILGPKPTDLTTITSALPRFRDAMRAKARDAMRNRTRPIDPTTIPYAQRAGGGGGGQAAPPPASRALAEEGEP